MEKILNLISLSYNEKESENYANFKPKKNEIDTLIEAAKEALSIFPNIPFYLKLNPTLCFSKSILITLIFFNC